MWGRIRLANKAVLLGMAFALCLGITQIGTAVPAAPQAASAKGTVYVCACMGNKSCPCMSMAKKEGKCACGEHAPNMKAVAADSAWAKTNRAALSK
ncbi:MAG: hypothetical protein P8Z30_14265 [Acidobacteriota bacterium]